MNEKCSINLPFTSVGFPFPKRPLLLTTGATLSDSLPSLRFLANRPCAFSKLLPKLPSPLFNPFSDSSLWEDVKAGIQTPASSKCPSPSVWRLPCMTSSKARSSSAFFLLPRRETRGASEVWGEDCVFAFPRNKEIKANQWSWLKRISPFVHLYEIVNWVTIQIKASRHYDTYYAQEHNSFF